MRGAAVVALGLAASSAAVAQQPPRSMQVAAALVALPAELRPGAGVVVFDPAGHPRTLRPPSNGIVCLGDAPGDLRFEVECYQEGLMPAVYRMRELRAAGFAEAEVERRIEGEIRDGRIALASRPMMNYQVAGPIAAYDSATNTLATSVRRTQRLFVPWSTSAATGVPTAGGTGVPWLMDAGTWFAHIMILPAPPPGAGTP